MTKEDLLGHNQGLLDFCGSLIAGGSLSRLKIESMSRGATSMRVTTLALDRLDVYLDGHPASSRRVTNGRDAIEVPSGWRELELRGYGTDQLRQRRRL